ncbi:MAG: porphobilinogen synthase [Alphaproteobacteria bacterium]|nr:porphobilinogen synthase [Alphaproteobacteria bacterium]
MNFNNQPSYPQTRLRRNRSQSWIRKLVAENNLTIHDLIWPVFIHDGSTKHVPIESMPGIYRLSLDALVEEATKAANLGILALALFPVIETDKKDHHGKEALNPNNLCNRAIKILKKTIPEMGVICDVALDPYTSHGHDGLLENNIILNDETLEILGKQALYQAEAGADIVAPSDMMDGRVGYIRKILDEAGYENCLIMSYGAKYASNFYGPFRDALGSKSALGKADKRTYQMDPANSHEALREINLDINEGADMVLIKPGMPYLDIVSRVKSTFHIPTFVYQVSGEYAMIKAAHEKGWLDEKSTMLESMMAFKRAGADGIFTYAALSIAQWLKEKI